MKIIEIMNLVSSRRRDDGWTLMSEVGTPLINSGIDIKSEGFSKLKHFFESYDEYFTIGIDDKTGHPLVKCKEDIVKKAAQDDKVCNSPQEDVKLTKWANINLRDAIESLKNMALPERWTYSEENSKFPNPILAKYLKWTFVKLYREDKILSHNGFASFDTGLVDRFYKPIYAVFEENKNNKQPWHFKGFCVAGDSNSIARILTENFSELPERATYIKKYDDVIYDPTLPVDVNWEHIILDNIDRIPTELLQMYCSTFFTIRDVSEMNKDDKNEYYKHLREELESHPNHLRLISDRMKMALETAKLRVKWNYKTVIPIFYPTDDSVHLILPLALSIDNPEEISLALVLTKMPSNRYRAVTVFTLDMAYSNARLITKPLSDWLIAS